MTEQELAEIEARLNAAAPGPWLDGPPPTGSTPNSGVLGCVRLWCDGRYVPQNTELIAHAPTDIAALIAEVRRLQTQHRELISAVKAERAAEEAIGDDLDPPAKFMQLPEWYQLQDAKAYTNSIADKPA